MLRRGLITAVAVIALVMAGILESNAGGRTAAAQNVVTIGALLDLRDGWTSLGRASRVTLRIATADANARLAKSGSPMRVRLKIVDIHGDPNAAAPALRGLAAGGARIVVGPQASSEVRAVRSAVKSLGVAVISQGSTVHSLAIAGDNVFRFVADDVRESEAMVALMKRDGVDAVAPVWREDTGNAGLVDSVRKRFKAGGGSVASGVRYGTSTTDFSGALNQLRDQVNALRSAGASHPAVYLAAFDEVVGLFDAASGDPVLGSVPWYGSDGVALTPRLVADAKAAAFAAAVGYPNPTLGLSDAVTRKAKKLVDRTRSKLGHEPDAFALTAYDALQVAVRASARAGTAPSAARLRRAIAGVADGYLGVTGKLTLNAAGDRSFGSFDFWSVCTTGGSASWKRTWSYVATAPGHGKIVARDHC
jgi:branched-chain amino acid transport system substrate-binding protein